MKTITLIAWFLWSVSSAVGQNLVSNGSFESSSSCPTNPADFGLMTNWGRPANHLGNADYYDVCGSGFVAVPSNYVGNQMPHTGNAYAGLVLYYPIFFNYREYLTTQLTSSMVAGQTYCVSFWVNLADTSAYFTDNALGIYFSNSPAVSPSSTGNPLPVTPQLEVNQPITDVVGWNEMRFNYTATGGEEYLTIGNFRFDSGTNATLYNPGTNWWEDHLYVLIDDLVVEPLPNASWNVPLALCTTDAPIDLSASIAGTAGGSFSGTGVTGNSFDPAFGTQSIMYTVGSTSCADTLTQLINVSPCALPVEFGLFDGSVENDGIWLHWNTLSELNSSHFTLERSNSGALFEELTHIAAQGNSQSEVTYNFLDDRPFSGTNYYRLTAYDLDGSISYTETIALEWSSNESSVYPNPVQDQITIETDGTGLKTVKLFSTDGKLLKEIETEDRILEWSVRNLPEGGYRISIESMRGQEVIFFIKSS